MASVFVSTRSYYPTFQHTRQYKGRLVSHACKVDVAHAVSNTCSISIAVVSRRMLGLDRQVLHGTAPNRVRMNTVVVRPPFRSL